MQSEVVEHYWEILLWSWVFGTTVQKEDTIRLDKSCNEIVPRRKRV